MLFFQRKKDYNAYMNHKSFIFFDCECANTFEGVGKICSIGYVLTDDELNVIESEDVIINPECEFDWYLLSPKNECHLAYSKDYFRIKPNFEAYYKDVKKLFTTGNRYIAGFAVHNDVGFVNSACKRYELPFIQFRALDLEKIFNQHYNQHKKLKEWAEFFGVNVAKFQTHKSVDDAMMTMLCLKKFCQEQNVSVESVFTNNKGLFVSSEQMLIQAEERAYQREMLEKIKRLYNKKCPKPHHKTLLDKHFSIDGKLLKDVDTSFELVKQIYDCGGVIHERLVNKGYIIFADDNIKADFKATMTKKDIECITLEQFYQMMMPN